MKVIVRILYVYYYVITDDKQGNTDVFLINELKALLTIYLCITAPANDSEQIKVVESYARFLS